MYSSSYQSKNKFVFVVGISTESLTSDIWKYTSMCICYVRYLFKEANNMIIQSTKAALLIFLVIGIICKCSISNFKELLELWNVFILLFSSLLESIYIFLEFCIF